VLECIEDLSGQWSIVVLLVMQSLSLMKLLKKICNLASKSFKLAFDAHCIDTTRLMYANGLQSAQTDLCGNLDLRLHGTKYILMLCHMLITRQYFGSVGPETSLITTKCAPTADTQRVRFNNMMLYTADTSSSWRGNRANAIGCDTTGNLMKTTWPSPMTSAKGHVTPRVFRHYSFSFFFFLFLFLFLFYFILLFYFLIYLRRMADFTNFKSCCEQLVFPFYALPSSSRLVRTPKALATENTAIGVQKFRIFFGKNINDEVF
jgi:hypothetical protein